MVIYLTCLFGIACDPHFICNHFLVTLREHSYKKSLVGTGFNSASLITTHAIKYVVNLPAVAFETTLSNGLQVIIREDHRSPMVMTQIWYKVGSTDESGNIMGISHVLEHMMFKGTSQSTQ